MDTDQLFDAMMASHWESFSQSLMDTNTTTTAGATNNNGNQQQNRGCLEPILEEESDDGEAGYASETSSTSSGSISSSSSGGSTVQLAEVNFLHGGLLRDIAADDSETLSERDYLCPAKRRRQDQFCLDVDYQKKRYRLDDYPSDSESSLSRSSSLIQFESIERQLLNENNNLSTVPQTTTAIVEQDFERFIPLAVQQQQSEQQQYLAPVTVSIKTKVTTLTTPTTTYYADKHQRLVDGDSNGGGTVAGDNILSTFFNRTKFDINASAPNRNHHHQQQQAQSGEERLSHHRGINHGGEDDDEYRDRHSEIIAFGRTDESSQFASLGKSRGKNSLEELSEDSGYCGDISLGLLLLQQQHHQQINDITGSRVLESESRSEQPSDSSGGRCSDDDEIKLGSRDDSFFLTSPIAAAPARKVCNGSGSSQNILVDETVLLSLGRGPKIETNIFKETAVVTTTTTADDESDLRKYNDRDTKTTVDRDEDDDEVEQEEEPAQLDMMMSRVGGSGGVCGMRIDECDEEMEQQEEVDLAAKNTRENKRFMRRKDRGGGVAHFPFGRKRKLGGCQRIASRSLPNIFLNQVASAETEQPSSSVGAPAGGCCIDNKVFAGVSSNEGVTTSGTGTNGADGDDLSDEFLKVNSYPDGLNYLLSSGGHFSDEEGHSSDHYCNDYEECQEFFSNDYFFLHGGDSDYGHIESVNGGGTISSKNLDLNQLLSSHNGSRGSVAVGSIRFPTAADQAVQHQSILSASYSNLTALDYSVPSAGRGFKKMDAGNSKRSGSGSGRATIANPEITLMDEISFNFDKNLSIINDRCGNFEPLIEDEDGEEEEAAVIGILNIKKPPKPPPRRYKKGDSMENLRPPMEGSATRGSSQASSKESLTFDRDPTNLVTCYAASLERCNFPVLEQPMVYQRNSHQLLTMLEDPGMNAPVASHQSKEKDKEVTVSTPNLSSRSRELQVFSGDSMCAENKSRTIGILNVSSRGSLYKDKEVSFHPIVSEISWRQHELHNDSLSEDSLNESDNCDSDVQEEVEEEKFVMDDGDDYFGLKKNENFKDLDLTSKDISSSTPAMITEREEPLQIITIKKTVFLTPVPILQDQGEQHPIKDIPSKLNDPASSQSPSSSSSRSAVAPISFVDNRDDHCSELIEEVVVDSSENASESDAVSASLSESGVRLREVDRFNQRQQLKQPRLEWNNSQEEEKKNHKGNNHNNNQDHHHRQDHQNSENSSTTIMPQSSSKTSSTAAASSSPLHMGPPSAKMPITSTAVPSPKKRKSSFFSRLSSFRFSLKNSKKEQQRLKDEKHEPITIAKLPPPPMPYSQTTPMTTTTTHNYNGNHNNNLHTVVGQSPYGTSSTSSGGGGNNVKRSATTNGSYVHIPLKDPVDKLDHFSKQKQAAQRRNEHQMFVQAEQRRQTIDCVPQLQHQQQQELVAVQQMPPRPPLPSAEHQQHQQHQHPYAGSRFVNNAQQQQQLRSPSSNGVLHKKPPLPKYPPRVIGVCAKRCADANNSQSLPRGGGEQQEYQLRDDNNNNQYGLSAYPQSSGGAAGDSEFRFVSHNPRRGGQAATMPQQQSASRIGLIETNLDTHETVISGKTRSLMELHPQHGPRTRYSHQMQQQRQIIDGGVVRQSMGSTGGDATAAETQAIRQRPHKSMEFLLDKENQLFTLPPENELQKIHETPMLSEHQLRVQASLQKLNIPDWYRQYNDSRGDLRSPTSPAPGQYAQRKRGSSGADGGAGIPPSSSGGHAKWTGLSSKTTSLSSLGGGSQRYDKSALLLLSPSSHSHHGGTTSTGYSRWSTSHLNSAQTSPSNSSVGGAAGVPRTSFTRGNYAQSSGHSFIHSANNGTNIRGSYRQPYLGWRSQEKLSQQGLRTPAERLASTLLATQQQQQQQQKSILSGRGDATDDGACSAALSNNNSIANESSGGRGGDETAIQSSIKEVTSAIVHYVNDQTNRSQNQTSRSRSTSPRRCWVESSFVGTGRLDSPQTPPVFETPPTSLCEDLERYGLQSTTTTTTMTTAEYSQTNGGLSSSLGHHHRNVVGAITTAPFTPRISTSVERAPRPGSASLEDVLSSLLGLPPVPNSHQHHRGATTPDHNNRGALANQSLNVNDINAQRRRSEGDARAPTTATATTKPMTGKDINLQHRDKILTDAKPSHASDQILLPSSGHQRRVSWDSSECATITTVGGNASLSTAAANSNQSQEMLKCRHPKCETRAANLIDAKKTFKSCHNCSHLYCSRECRRQHWERHRKACLHSRISALCRQVLSACKDDPNSLRNLSLLARRGYLEQGRGVVRILFRSPEAAESFLRQGFQQLGEASYVRWMDLLPAEMGAELYSELLRLSTEYKPETKMLIYVAVCVVSEVPSGRTSAPVRWERQLVSRCAKLKLCKAALRELAEAKHAEVTDETAEVAKEPPLDIVILTFNAMQKIAAQEKRETILKNIQRVLQSRGVVLGKHFPEVLQRINTFVEGITDRFVPVTMHPKDVNTGREFVCIIMPNTEATMRMPKTDSGENVQVFNVSRENLVF